MDFASVFGYLSDKYGTPDVEEKDDKINEYEEDVWINSDNESNNCEGDVYENSGLYYEDFSLNLPFTMITNENENVELLTTAADVNFNSDTEENEETMIAEVRINVEENNYGILC